MPKKIRVLICLFLVGFVAGACGRKFRAIDQNGTIEARAALIANEKFSVLFDTDLKYQDHIRLKNELMAMEFMANSNAKQIGVGVMEKDCVTRESGSSPYTDMALFQSTKGSPLLIPGSQNYGFHAACIPTATSKGQQCIHFVVAIQKRYAEGRIGAVLAVVGLDSRFGNWLNLEMSDHFLYGANLKTVKEVGASFACSTGRTTTLPQTGGGSTTPTDNSPSATDVIKDKAFDWAKGKWDDWWKKVLNGDSNSTTDGSSTTTPPIYDDESLETDDDWIPLTEDDDYWLY